MPKPVSRRCGCHEFERRAGEMHDSLSSGVQFAVCVLYNTVRSSLGTLALGSVLVCSVRSI